MLFDFDFEKLEKLLQSFYRISNIRYSLADTESNLLCFSSDFEEFCCDMNKDEAGHLRCLQSDAAGIACARAADTPYYTYRCHAGLWETVIPIRQHGECIAYIMFGQVVGQGCMEEHWKQTRERIDWMDCPDAMRESFMKLQQVEPELIDGCAQILNACSSYICMEGLIRSSSMSDEQQLNQYISEHYSEPLTLEIIAKALSMSKTKLCSIAAKQNSTVMTMLHTRRMEEAKRLFRHKPHERVSEIAYLVGIRDYNYFTKLFKAYTGETPRAYQKRHHKRHEPPQ